MIKHEKQVFTEILYNKQAVLTWDFTKIRKVKKKVASLQKIEIVNYKAQYVLGFQIFKALTSTVINKLQNRLKIGIIELCHGCYQNSYYLIKKITSGQYQLVNIAFELNRVTIRDANLPLSIEKFSQLFVRCVISSLIKFFSNYVQFELIKISLEFTVFMTVQGLMRMTISI